MSDFLPICRLPAGAVLTPELRQLIGIEWQRNGRRPIPDARMRHLVDELQPPIVIDIGEAGEMPQDADNGPQAGLDIDIYDDPNDPET